MLRSILESLTRNWLYERTLAISAKRAPILVSPSGGLRYLFRRMEAIDPTLIGQAVQFISEGDVVWDVGANVGLFSVAAASLAGPSGKVYAFEPDSWLVYALRQTALRQTNFSSPISVIPAALASDVALRSFVVARRSRATNHLSEYGTTQTGGVLEQITVLTLPLDWLVERLPAPDVIKIDVEGAEIEVLEGGKRLFDIIKPIVLCEVAAESSSRVAQFFQARDYVLLDGDQPELNRKPLDRAPPATIAIPNQRSPRADGSQYSALTPNL